MEVTVEVIVGSRYRAQETLNCSSENDPVYNDDYDLEQAIKALDNCYKKIRSQLEGKAAPITKAGKVNPDAESRDVQSGPIKMMQTRGAEGYVIPNPGPYS